MSGNTQNDCHSSWYRPALRISSCRIASALRSVSRRSFVASPPTTRIASPGPGNGWRQTRRSGSPSSAPTARTSSLNSARSGSTSSNRRSSGSPPTLWWDLIVAAPGLDDVGVQRALDEVAHVAEPRGLLLEDADELRADRLALGLGVRHAG